jgi:hypothetical protein
MLLIWSRNLHTRITKNKKCRKSNKLTRSIKSFIWLNLKCFLSNIGIQFRKHSILSSCTADNTNCDCGHWQRTPGIRGPGLVKYVKKTTNFTRARRENDVWLNQGTRDLFYFPRKIRNKWFGCIVREMFSLEVMRCPPSWIHFWSHSLTVVLVTSQQGLTI